MNGYNCLRFELSVHRFEFSVDRLELNVDHLELNVDHLELNVDRMELAVLHLRSANYLLGFRISQTVVENCRSSRNDIELRRYCFESEWI